MASNITPGNIDGTYPIAGIDNDTQGFRTNFTNTGTNFTSAKTEIEDLQAKAILKAPLSGESVTDNDMLGEQLISAQLIDTRETVFNLGATMTGGVDIDHQLGQYQYGATTGAVTLTLSNFPATTLGRVRLEIDVTNIAHTLTLPAAVTNGVDFIDGYSANVITFVAIGVFVFEIYSYDATTYTINDLTRDSTIAISVQADADGDTQIQVEETADEDIIRFDTGDNVTGFPAQPNALIFSSGQFTLALPTADVATTVGAPISLTAGVGNTTGLGGAFTIAAGLGGATAAGGALNITGGAGGGTSGNGGDVIITGGAVTSGVVGDVVINSDVVHDGGHINVIATLANDATPSILGGRVWITGGIIAITDFDDGVAGQEILILSEHAITITDGTNILLNGSVDFVMAAGDNLTLIQKADTFWHETSRMVNL